MNQLPLIEPELEDIEEKKEKPLTHLIQKYKDA